VTTFLFWDVDGTLLKTGRAGIFAFEEAVASVCGVEVDLQQLFTSGLTDAEVAALVLETAGQEAGDGAVERILRAYEQALPASLPRRQGEVLPGVREVLEDLAGRDDVRSLLLTGNTPAGARAKLAHYRLDRFFPNGTGACCIGPGKRVDIARRALTLADGAEHVYVIGDTPHDVECGRAIGARTIAVASGWHSVEQLAAAEPWIVLERIPEPAAFRRLVGLD
jgi:phosphoglycolate phosphatase-like HAD superfamily hydrolase